MLGLNGTHLLMLIIVLVIALVIFGPRRLPEVGYGVGKAIREFKKATSEVTDAVAKTVEHPTGASPSAVPPAAGPDVPAASPPPEGEKPAG